VCDPRPQPTQKLRTFSRSLTTEHHAEVPQEWFGFRIPNYGLDHQGGAIVDLFVDLDFKDDVDKTDPYAYPEFVSVANFI